MTAVNVSWEPPKPQDEVYFHDLIAYHANNVNDIVGHITLIIEGVRGVPPTRELVQEQINRSVGGSYKVLAWETREEYNTASTGPQRLRWGNIGFARRRGLYLYWKGRGMLLPADDHYRSVNVVHYVDDDKAKVDGQFILFATQEAAQSFAYSHGISVAQVKPFKVYDFIGE